MKHSNFFRILAVLLLLCLPLGTLSSCEFGLKRQYTDYSFDYFDTVTSVIGYEANRNAFDGTFERILDKLEYYHRLYDIYHSYEGINNLYILNRDKGSAENPIKVAPEIIDLLEFAKDCYTKTDGYVNIAMGSVLSLWHDQRVFAKNNPDLAKLPDPEALAAAAEHTDISKIVINKADSTVYLADSEMKLDVGAIAKGYAVERVAEMLEAEGKSGYVLNVGGNVRTVGTMKDGSPWPVGIENPDKSDTNNPYVATLALAGEALVTSGTAQRYYVVNGQSYHHIIDKDTLYPAEGYLSVSIVSPDSGLADALSTALFCMSIEEGRTVLARFPEVSVVWVRSDGSREYSDGFLAYTTR